MRKIDEKMVSAVNGGRNFHEGNTQVRHEGGVAYVYLHGNLIAKKTRSELFFTLAGWDTLTTRNRLRALGVELVRENKKTYCNGEEIKGSRWYNGRGVQCI